MASGRIYTHTLWNCRLQQNREKEWLTFLKCYVFVLNLWTNEFKKNCGFSIHVIVCQFFSICNNVQLFQKIQKLGLNDVINSLEGGYYSFTLIATTGDSMTCLVAGSWREPLKDGVVCHSVKQMARYLLSSSLHKIEFLS